MQPIVHLRPATPDDIPAMGALARARELAFAGVAETTDDQIAHDLAGPDVDLALDTRIAEDADGRVVGYGDVLVEDRGVLGLTVWTPPEDDPVARAAEAALFAALQDRAVEVGCADGIAAVTVHLYLLAADTFRADLLAARGYRHVRTYHRMVLPPTAEVPAATLPAGVALCPIDPERDAEAVHALLRQAFADHDLLGVPEDLAAWRHLTLDEPRWVPGPSLVARAGGVLVGAVVGFPEDEQGWIRHLGVTASHRGRGLGAALLTGAIAAFHERGLAQIGLGVDSGNTTGATRLYERVGMEVAHRWYLYEVRLPSGNS